MLTPSLGALRLHSLTLLLSALVAQNSWACRTPPEQQLISVNEQVKLASDVSIAQVTSATPLEGRLVEYRFVVLRRLAGQVEGSFTVTGRAAASRGKHSGYYSPVLARPGTAGGGNDTSSDHHADPSFWRRGGGRVMNGGDCRIYPDFVVGGTYLVFLNSPWTWRSFEKIDLVNGAIDDEDKWLAYVAAALKARNASERPGTTLAPPG